MLHFIYDFREDFDSTVKGYRTVKISNSSTSIKKKFDCLIFDFQKL